ncbi:MAG: phosphatidate cytidylyltransferase [Christensenellales bacterium]
MLKRIVTGIVLLVCACLLIIYQGWYLRIALLIIAALSIYEMHTALAARGAKAVRWPAYLFVLLAFFQQAFGAQLWWLTDSPLLIAVILCVMGGILSIVFLGKADYDGLVATLLPILYPGLFYAFLMRLQDLDGRAVPTMALAMAVIVPSMNDMFALFIGKAVGKRKLCPEISPNKTVAGSVAGIAASIATTMIIPAVIWRIDIALNGAQGAILLAPYWVYAIFGLLLGIISQAGDLMASLIKRSCNIKDFGKLFPGHGGMLDRLDAILFGGVACYLFFMLTGH